MNTIKQNEIKHLKQVLKKDVIRMRKNAEEVKIRGNTNSYKYAVSILKITIHLHNFNIVEARKEEINFNRIISDSMNAFLFDEKTPSCQIKNYVGCAENESENARQLGESQKRSAENLNRLCRYICYLTK